MNNAKFEIIRENRNNSLKVSNGTEVSIHPIEAKNEDNKVILSIKIDEREIQDNGCNIELLKQQITNEMKRMFKRESDIINEIQKSRDKIYIALKNRNNKLGYEPTEGELYTETNKIMKENHVIDILRNCSNYSIIQFEITVDDIKKIVNNICESLELQKEIHKDKYLSTDQTSALDTLVSDWIPKLEAMFRNNTLTNISEEMGKDTE